MPILTKPNVDYQMDELVQALSRLAILPTAEVEQGKVADSTATLPLNNTTTNQLEPARAFSQDDNKNVVMEGTPDSSDTLLTETESNTITDDSEPQIEQFPRHSPALITTRSKYELDQTDCRIGTLKRNDQRAREKLRNDARRMQGYLGQCLRWLDHHKYIRNNTGIRARYAEVEWLKKNLAGRLECAGYLSGALQSWKPNDVDRLVTWNDILVVQAKLEEVKETPANKGFLNRRPSCYL